MDAIILKLIEEMFLPSVQSLLEQYFNQVQEMQNEIVSIASTAPDAWLGGEPWALVTAISENVMLPIVGLILSCVLCIELIGLVIDKNKMSEVDVGDIYKYVFKMMICIFAVTRMLPFIAGIFQVGAWLVEQTGGILAAGILSPSESASEIVSVIKAESETTMGAIGQILTVWISTGLANFVMIAINIMAKLAVYGRMIEIMLYCSVGQIPFATMGNKEWSSICVNYIKSLFALAFQGFLIVFVVKIYSIILMSSNFDYSNMGAIVNSLFGRTGWGVLLCFALFKTGSIAKSIFNAH